MTTRLLSDTARTIEEQAAFWMVRLTAPECSPEDRRAFEAWRRSDPSHQTAYDRQVRASRLVDRLSADPAMQELVDEARAEITPWRRPPRVWAIAGSAAALVLAVTAALALPPAWFGRDDEPPASADLSASNAYETAIGERSTVSLSDASAITLNTETRVEIAFTSETRMVRLVRGQAYFEVAPDHDRPFIVEAGGRRIVALGTAFDVRADAPEYLQVTLVEGRVTVVDVTRGPASATPAEPQIEAASVELSPGERLVAHRDAAPVIAAADVEALTSWRDGRLIFREAMLGEVVDEMNRYSRQQLVMGDDARLREMTVSGVFNAGRVSSFIAALEVMHPLVAERTGEREITLVWRE